MKLCAVSVDLDEIPNYFRIHGLAEPGPLARHAVYDVAIDRLLAMAAAGGMPLTLFAIGSDLARPESATKLRHAREAGHEMANHTLDHRYDLTRLERSEIAHQIGAGADAIERATGERPVGFRAPGYTITDQVFSVLRELEVRYDSSVFPCPAYYAAKATALGLIRLRGRTSHSVLDTPRVLTAPLQPYRAGVPYWKSAQDGLLELPIQVTRGLRLPVIGTSITLAGPGRARMLARMCVGMPLVNLELHGIDVLDAGDGLDALLPYQPDVRVSRERKLESLHAAFDTLRNAGYSFVTLREAAAAFG